LRRFAAPKTLWPNATIAARQLAEASALLDEARERLGNSDVTRLPRRTLQDARNSLDAAETSLQEARTALNADDYAAATKAIESATGRIHKTNEGIDTALEKLPPRRRR
jgi:multidrug resistance efflux pump